MEHSWYQTWYSPKRIVLFLKGENHFVWEKVQQRKTGISFACLPSFFKLAKPYKYFHAECDCRKSWTDSQVTMTWLGAEERDGERYLEPHRGQ